MKPIRILAFAVTSGVFLLVPLAPLHAQGLPVISYTTKDGMPHDIVHRVVRDARGFLWLGTSTALARFDGERFTAYARADGLDVGTGVNDMKDAGNRLWIATNGDGIVRFDLVNADRARRFRAIRVGEGRASNRVNTLALMSDGTIWAGTDAGLWVGSDAQPFRLVTLPIPNDQAQARVQVTTIAVEPSWLWIGTTGGVFRCTPLPGAECVLGSSASVLTLMVGRGRQLWLGGGTGLELAQIDDANALQSKQRFAAGARVRRLMEASDGAVLVATEDGRVLSIVDNVERVLFSASDGARINDVAEDTARNLWVGTNLGLISIRRQGVTLFSAQHGLRGPYVRTLRLDPAGQVYALTEDDWLHRIDGKNCRRCVW